MGKSKSRGASEEQQSASTGPPDWLNDFPEMMQDVTDAQSRNDNPAQELVASIRYTVFGGKQSLMRGFQQEATHLELAVDRMTTGGDSRSELFD